MNSEIRNYIDKARSFGQSDDFITQSLLRSGWSIEDIKSNLVSQDIKKIFFLPFWSYLVNLWSKFWLNKKSFLPFVLVFGFLFLTIFWFAVKIYLKISSGLLVFEFFALAFVLILIFSLSIFLLSTFIGFVAISLNSTQKVSLKDLIKESLKKSGDIYFGLFVFIGLLFAGYRAVFLPGIILFLIYSPIVYLFTTNNQNIINNLSLSRKSVFHNLSKYLLRKIQIFIFLVFAYLILTALGDLILFFTLRYSPSFFKYMVFVLQGCFAAIFTYLFFGLEFISAHELLKNQSSRPSFIEKIILILGLILLVIVVLGLFSPFIQF